MYSETAGKSHTVHANFDGGVYCLALGRCCCVALIARLA